MTSDQLYEEAAASSAQCEALLARLRRRRRWARVASGAGVLIFAAFCAWLCQEWLLSTRGQSVQPPRLLHVVQALGAPNVLLCGFVYFGVLSGFLETAAAADTKIKLLLFARARRRAEALD